MDDVSTHTSKPVTSRRRKPATVRTYHTALHEVGASRLTDEELAIVTKALVILENKVIRQGDVFDSPARAKPWLILHYGMLDREVFGLVFLDTRHRYLGHQQLFTGTIDGASVHPRQVARSVFEYNAAAVCAVTGIRRLVFLATVQPPPGFGSIVKSRRARETAQFLGCTNRTLPTVRPSSWLCVWPKTMASTSGTPTAMA